MKDWYFFNFYFAIYHHHHHYYYYNNSNNNNNNNNNHHHHHHHHTFDASITTGLPHFNVVEFQMASVERIVLYTELEQEAPAHTEDQKPLPEPWPHRGQITFDHVTVSYSKDDHYALNDICLIIPEGQKVSTVELETTCWSI